MLSPSITEAAQAHARSLYPSESCGLVIAGIYQPCTNIADDPLLHFAIHPKEYARLVKAGKVETVVHSHPNGPMFPTMTDMTQQIESGVMWAIIPLDEDRIGPAICWGGDTPIQPLIGRTFMHGVSDCYSLMRDTFRLGREGCALQDIEWPFPPIEFPEIPRDDAWWEGDDDLYFGNFDRLGFKPIGYSDIRPGDVFLAKIRSEKLNHGGLLISNSLIMQHFPERLSRREPAGLWARQAEMWIRYEGPFNA